MSLFTTFSILQKFRPSGTVLKIITRHAICKKNEPIMEPTDRAALITGGDNGIGFATAHKLLCAKACHVILFGLDLCKGMEAVDNLNCSFGQSKATFMKVDVTDNKQVAEAMLKVKNDFKNLDIFVNCAGIWDEKNWNKQLITNLNGTITVTKAILDTFKTTCGMIINFTGVMGLQIFPSSPVFSAGNLAVVRFCQNMGHEINFKNSGMRIVALCTGVTSCTDFTKDIETRMCCPTKAKGVIEYLKNAHKQRPDACAKAVLELIRYSPSGAVWVIEGSRLFVVNMPNWKEHCVLVSQFT